MRSPTTEGFVTDFGLRSSAFQWVSVRLRDSWTIVKAQDPFRDLFRQWGRCLAVVYGSEVASDELFVRQTYLATLARLMAWKSINGEDGIPNEDLVAGLVRGTYFEREGIFGLGEDDFFSWTAFPEVQEAGAVSARRLLGELNNYNLNHLSEDVLKSLYLELVDPDCRHGLGEYYTPDWLAHRIVRRVLEARPEASIFDPACGSGSFVCAIVREKRARLGDSCGTLIHIVESVCAADVHPLAVIVAKTNYILSLGELLRHQAAALTIPVQRVDVMSGLDGEKGSGLSFSAPDCETIRCEQRADVRGRTFDAIVGNPPWISYRFLQPARQEFMKGLAVAEYGLYSHRADLITHVDVATLFLLRSAELSLKTGGTIGFVLPRSVFSADQHHHLRTGEFRFGHDFEGTLSWREIWDCEGVAPLFDVPTSVLIAEKAPKGALNYPVPGEILRGKLARKNASLEEAEQSLTVEPVHYHLHRVGNRSFWATVAPKENSGRSPYGRLFAQGASMVPRSFWLVDVSSSRRGINPELAAIATSAYARSQAKAAYKDVCVTGNVERRFLYATLLSSDLLPFGHLAYRLAVLPIEPRETRYQIVDAQGARKRGLLCLAQWLEKVEQEWQARRGRKAAGLSALEWLDYRGKLTGQNPRSRYCVIYNTSGTFLTAAVLERGPIHLPAAGQEVTAEGFVADTKTYWYETDNKDEAYYLAAILNAPVIDELIKPMQSRGSFGPRDIHKKVFELSVPRFDKRLDVHLQVARLGKTCSERVLQWLAESGQGETKSIGRLRARVRKLLHEDLIKLTALVESILK